MAVKTKHLNDLLKEISKELQQLQGDLMEITGVFKQRREAVEKHCWQCQDLLKPWPSKVVQLYSSDIQTDEKLDETDGILQPEKPSCTSMSDPEVEKEKQELAMLDDILAKAHHARDIQNKMSKPAKKSHSAKPKPSGLSNSQVKETKPKVSYPVLKRPSSAKSTYSASYVKPATKIKTLKTGPKKASVASKTTVTSRQEPRRQPELKRQQEQVKTTVAKSHEPRKSTCEDLSKNTIPPRALIPPVTENATSMKPRPKCEADTNTTTAGTKFLISEKGSTLNMPAEFREICKEHKKLLRRVKKTRTSTRRPSEEQFVKRVEELFFPELHRFPTALELEEEIYRLQKEYRELLSLVKMKSSSMQSAKETTTQRSSDCSDDGKTVLSKSKGLNEEAQIIRKNLDFLSKYCPLLNHKSVVFGEDVDGELSSCFTGRKYSKTDPDGCFSYHNIKELKTFLKLWYDYQIMKLQFDVRNMIGETILPLLRQLPANHNSFGPLCRVVYSILCCDGKTFPTLVKDSLTED